MKKILSICLTGILLVLLLSGCVHNEVGVQVRENGTGSVSVTVGCEEEYYSQLMSNGSDPFDGKETFTYQYNDATYIGYKETKECDSYEEIEKAFLQISYNDLSGKDESEADEQKETIPVFTDVKISKDSGLFKSKYDFWAKTNPGGAEYNGYDFNEVFKLSISVELPGEIVEADGGTVDGNKVTYNLEDLTQVNEVHVESQTTNTTGIVVVIAFVIVIIAIGVFAAFKRKKI